MPMGQSLRTPELVSNRQPQEEEAHAPYYLIYSTRQASSSAEPRRGPSPACTRSCAPSLFATIDG